MELGVPCGWECRKVGSEAGAGHRCEGVFVTWALDFSSSRPCRFIKEIVHREATWLHFSCRRMT